MYKYKNGIYLWRRQPVRPCCIPTQSHHCRLNQIQNRAAALLQDAVSPQQINYFLDETQLNGAHNIRGLTVALRKVVKLVITDAIALFVLNHKLLLVLLAC